MYAGREPFPVLYFNYRTATIEKEYSVDFLPLNSFDNAIKPRFAQKMLKVRSRHCPPCACPSHYLYIAES
jgi:hypothetical protein